MAMIPFIRSSLSPEAPEAVQERVTNLLANMHLSMQFMQEVTADNQALVLRTQNALTDGAREAGIRAHERDARRASYEERCESLVQKLFTQKEQLAHELPIKQTAHALRKQEQEKQRAQQEAQIASLEEKKQALEAENTRLKQVATGFGINTS